VRERAADYRLIVGSQHIKFLLHCCIHPSASQYLIISKYTMGT
jgi:hypothetical protein